MNTEHNTTQVNTILDTAFEGHPVRVFGTPENPLFVRADLQDILEVQNLRIRPVEERDLIYIKCISGGQTRELVCVNEMGLYELIFRSQTDAAKRFRRWVCEVIREIRLKGYYLAPAHSPAMVEVQRARLRLQAAEHRAEAERLLRAALALSLPPRPEGYETIGEYLSPDLYADQAEKLSLSAAMGRRLRHEADHIWVRDKHRCARRAYPLAALHRAFDSID